MRSLGSHLHLRNCAHCCSYNNLDQLVCKLCNQVIKSEALWQPHLLSRGHKEVSTLRTYRRLTLDASCSRTLRRGSSSLSPSPRLRRQCQQQSRQCQSHQRRQQTRNAKNQSPRMPRLTIVRDCCVSLHSAERRAQWATTPPLALHSPRKRGAPAWPRRACCPRASSTIQRRSRLWRTRSRRRRSRASPSRAHQPLPQGHYLHLW